MSIHFSFSLWTPEIYVQVGAVHFYASIWKVALLVTVIVLVWLRRRNAAKGPWHRRRDFSAISPPRALVWITLVAYFLAAAWPLNLSGIAFPWANPPDHVRFEGSDYGSQFDSPDPRVDTYRCNSKESIASGTFTDGVEVIELKQVGQLAGVFGGPSLFLLRVEDGRPWLVVRPTDDCWIPYPEWI